jgi:hypothetical protein
LEESLKDTPEPQAVHSNVDQDDPLTVIAIAALACILQDVAHEGLGHALTAWLSGAQTVTVSTVAMQSNFDTRWIQAGGTLVNLFLAAVLWILLQRPQHYRPVTRYFLVLAMASNLFTSMGYFLFSRVANFGDWAQVIQPLHPHWMWRLGLVVLGAISYYASMLVVGAELNPFCAGSEPLRRLRRLCWTPYFAEGILAGVAGLLNPAGVFYVVASALPSTLGANAGLLSLPSIMRRWKRTDQNVSVAPLRRSPAWITSAVIIGLPFVFVLGRGITWSR